jgi:hypothetical protein
LRFHRDLPHRALIRWQAKNSPGLVLTRRGFVSSLIEGSGLDTRGEDEPKRIRLGGRVHGFGNMQLFSIVVL